MKYTFKFQKEFFWGLALTALSFVALEIYTADLDVITNWAQFFISLGLGCARSVAGYVFGQINGPDETKIIDEKIKVYQSQLAVATTAKEKAELQQKINALEELKLLL